MSDRGSERMTEDRSIRSLYLDYPTRRIIESLAEYEDAEEQGNADDVCEYKEQKNKFGQHIFITSCSKDLIQYGFMFEYNYCPYCGKKIRMVE